MGPRGRGGGGGLGEGEEERVRLQAVVIADSFEQRFRPATFTRPKALQPLAGIPMLDYVLAWLAANNVDEVFVFCCAHAELVMEHVEKYGGRLAGGAALHTVVSTACTSAGEALRLIYEQNIVRTDFVLMTADTLANFDLAPVLEAHRARKKRDKDALLMTLTASRVSHPACRAREGREGVMMTYDPASCQLLGYDKCERSGGGDGGGGGPDVMALDTAAFGERSQVQVRTDLADCHIDVCSPEVLGIVNDNFDYQHLRDDFITGVLSEEELGKKIYLHELSGLGRAARATNLRAFDAASKDVLGQWFWPYSISAGLVGTEKAAPEQPTPQPGREDISVGPQVKVGKGAVLEGGTSVGAFTSLGAGARVSRSVVGQTCAVGAGAVLEGCYLQNGVQVGDGARLERCLVCDNVQVGAGAHVGEGCVLGADVVVAPHHAVPPFSRVTCRHSVGDGDDYDDDDEIGAQVIEVLPGQGGQLFDPALGVPPGARDEAVVGAGGHGWLWDQPPAEDPAEGGSPGGEGDSPRRHRVSGVDSDDDGPSERELFLLNSLVPRAGDCGPVYDSPLAAARAGGGEGAGDEESVEDEVDPESLFAREVQETILRCVKEGFAQTNAIVELNALKLAEDRTFADCARFIFTSLLGLCQPAPAGVPREFAGLFPAAAPGRPQLLLSVDEKVRAWGGLLEQFLRQEDDQVELLLTLEEYCQGGGAFAEVFPQLLNQLYQADVLTEEAIFAWADEKQHAEEEEKKLLGRAQAFVDWLRDADEEDSEEEGSDGSEEDSEEDG